MAKTIHRSALALFIGCVTLISPGQAQEPERQGPPPLPPELGGPDPRQEMLDLFARVERNLKAIDDMLYEASAGSAALENAEESGIGDLLRNSIDQGGHVLEDIDRILEIAESQQQQQGSQSSNQQPQESGSGQPSGQNQPGEQGRREGAPETPDQIESGEQQEPQPNGQQEQEQPQEGEPNSPRDPQDPSAQNSPGDKPPQSETERVRVIQDVDRWGQLPIHVREIFSSEGGNEQMPSQYRDWIESYYRRLSRTSD